MQFLLSVFQVIVRLRANKHLSSLGEFVTDWRKGKFTREHTSKRLLLLGIFFYLSIRVSALNFSLAACVAAVPFPFPGGDGTSERKRVRAKEHACGEEKIGEKCYFSHPLPVSYLRVSFWKRLLRGLMLS